MKKFIITLFTIFSFSVTAHSQITKGTWMVGGNAGFSTTNSRYTLASTQLTTASLSPDAGYFVMDKLALGINAGFSFTTYKLSGTLRTTQHSYAFGPFVRYYILPADNRVNLLAGGSYQHYISEPGNSFSNDYSFFAGPTAFFNSSVAMEVTAGFNSLITKNFTTNSFIINAGLQIYLVKR